MQKQQWISMILVTLIVFFFTSCSTLVDAVLYDGKHYISDWEKTSYYKGSSANWYEQESAFSKLPEISIYISSIRIRYKDVEITPSDESVEKTRIHYEQCKEAYTGYIDEYGPTSEIAYNDQHYSDVVKKLSDLESSYSWYCSTVNELKKRDAQQAEIKSSILETFEDLKKARDAGNTEKVYEVFNALDSLYSTYLFEDVDYILPEVREIYYNANKYTWKTSEKCKEILDSIGDTWLDLPLYISSENLQKTLREVIEGTDFSSSFFDVTADHIFNSLVLIIAKSYNSTSTFTMEVKNGKMVIKEVTCPLLSVYYSSNPYEIAAIFGLVFDVE